MWNSYPIWLFKSPILREEASRIFLIYQVVRCHKDENFEEYTQGIELQTNYKA